MRDLLVLTILNLIRPLWLSYESILAIITCAGALIVLTRIRQARASERSQRLAHTTQPAITSISPPNPSTISTRFSFESNLPLHAAHHQAPLPHASILVPFYAPASTTHLGSDTPSMACEDSRIPSALQASGDLATTPQSASTSEETIIPPFWRHIESLLGEHRASLLALSGETQSEAGVIEPAPPIWRGASALRIEGAQLEGAPGATEQGSQEIVWESAPQPPIWPMAQSRGYSGLALASARLESEYDGAERASVHLIASPPPIWSSWFASAWPEAPSQPAIEDDQLPIWSSFLRQ